MGLTLPSSGPAYGRPLKSNVRPLSMSPLRRSSSLPRRVFVHGLVLPLRLGSRHSRGPSSLPQAAASVVPLARLQSCGQKTGLATALRPSRATSGETRENSFSAGASSPPPKVCFSATQTVTASCSRPNLKYEVQFSSCPGTQVSRSQRSAESSSHLLGAFPTGTLTSPSSGLAFGSPLK
jgi:hypothetical protein